MYSWPFTFVIVTALFFLFIGFVVLFFNKYTWDSSRSWCTPGCHSLSSVPNWGGSMS